MNLPRNVVLHRASRGLLTALGLFLGSLPALFAATPPQWIWAAPDPTPGAEETVLFRHTFRTPPYLWNARLSVAADDRAEIFLNGKPIAASSRWDQPVRAEVSMRLNQGENVLAVRARHREGPAGLVVHLNLGGATNAEVQSDGSWLVSRREVPGWTNLAFVAQPPDWSPARVVGPHGQAPWGEVLFQPAATPAETLRVPPGFGVSLLRSAGRNEGSWVCLTFDDRGRLWISPEGDAHPLLRLTLGSEGAVQKVEPMPAPLRFAMGLLFAHGSLYANAKGPQGAGLYRLTDTNGNDQFDADEVRLLKNFKGGGEHGYHALALGPEGKIYVLNGNGTKPLDDFAPRSPYRDYAEDILSLNPDDGARARGALAPGSYVARTDPEGQTWELVAGGLRNAYDFDFNPEGELFTFDSDNEWDWGTPWYRATRVYHLVPGGEAGWRDGARAWPDHYPDKLSGVLDIGIGSPCGVKFGTRAHFPARYREALFLQDWSYGRILAVHLEDHGATYRGTFEEFLKGQPLNLTSMAFGPDGALYFCTGGRGTQSGLYRVAWTNALPVETTRASPPSEARLLRRELEARLGRDTAGSLDRLWPSLGSADASLRYAARVLLEHSPLPAWRERALSETNTTAALTALLGLARVGGQESQAPLLKALARFPLASLDEAHRLLKLRVIELSFLRQGEPTGALHQLAIDKLSPRYPATSWPENRELVRLLTYLDAPGVIPRTLALIDQAPSFQERFHYVSQLRHLTNGWSAADRERYFRGWLQPRDALQRPGSLLHWFHDVGREYVEGAGLLVHLEAARREAVTHLDAAEKESLRALIEAPIPGGLWVPPEPRAFVRDWTTAELLPDLERAERGRNFERGRRAFIDAQCYACHRFGNVGGAVGPEITAAASKYTRRDLLESMTEPSKIISEQYQNTRVFLKDGEEVTGRVLRDSPTDLVLQTDPLKGTELTVPRAQVEELRPSTVSPMPEGLLGTLTREEILDLLAFLVSGGDPQAPAFRTP